MKKHCTAFRVFQVLAAPLKLAVLVGGIAALMVYVNYTIDCSGLYQGDLTNRTIVDLLLSGEAVSNFDQMNERAVLELYAGQLSDEQAPHVLALGSSRVMQLTAGAVGRSDYYNCGMTGADYRDVINEYYAFEKAGRTPDAVILNIDPWFFRGDDSGLDIRTDVTLYNEFLAVDLGIDSGYTPPVESRAYRLADRALGLVSRGTQTLEALNITSDTLSALFEPAYFQGNVSYCRRRQASAVATTEDGAIIPYVAVSAAERAEIDSEVKMPDGTIWYSAAFRANDSATVLSMALDQAGTFLRMSGYTQLDTAQCALFEQFVAHMQAQGVKVYFMLSPYHPFVYEYERVMNYDDHAGFFAIEPYVRQYAADHGITVIGSYDPNRLGLTEEDFYDGLHVKESGILKFFGGLAADGTPEAGSVTNSALLAVNPADDPARAEAESAAAA